MTFSIDNPGGLQQPPLGKYVWEKPSGEQGLSWQCNVVGVVGVVGACQPHKYHSLTFTKPEIPHEKPQHLYIPISLYLNQLIKEAEFRLKLGMWNPCNISFSLL